MGCFYLYGSFDFAIKRAENFEKTCLLNKSIPILIFRYEKLEKLRLQKTMEDYFVDHSRIFFYNMIIAIWLSSSLLWYRYVVWFSSKNMGAIAPTDPLHPYHKCKCFHVSQTFPFGTIHILRKQRGWVCGVCKMLTFAYMVVGWVKANTYVSKILEIIRTFNILGKTFLIIS